MKGECNSPCEKKFQRLMPEGIPPGSSTISPRQTLFAFGRTWKHKCCNRHVWKGERKIEERIKCKQISFTFVFAPQMKM